MMPVVGEVTWIGGPVVRARGMGGAKVYEMVEIGEERLIGEVVQLERNSASIQVYEDTTGLKPGDPVYGTGEQFSAALGPGLIGSIYDGIQRPLDLIAEKTGSFIRRGVKASPLSRDKKWHFTPQVKSGVHLGPGDTLGTVQESFLVEHKIMVPPFTRGILKDVASEGDYSIDDVIAEIRTGGELKKVKMYQKWPVRRARPYVRKIPSIKPLVTGTRIIDTFFPVAKGGTVCVPGGFGSGKTVLLHTIAAWADAQVVIYIGCGERGNEMTDILEKFHEYKDPTTHRPLMERTILIANTSNMPVSAREASVYIGITMAEYYRDMGYDVLLVADSTSRWAEALREISGRLGELPADRGYPSYLASRIAGFYERAGMVVVNDKTGETGSITICGAVSPPEGDYTEPVTAHTRRFTSVFWALDTALAYSRQYPAINPLVSYSPYISSLKDWWSEKVGGDWVEYRDKALALLQEEAELREIARILGSEALPDPEKFALQAARLLKDGFLHQNAFHPVDVYLSPLKQYKMLKIIMDFYAKAQEALAKKAPLSDVMGLSVRSEIRRLKNEVPNEELDRIDLVYEAMINQFEELEAQGEVEFQN